MLHVWEQLTVKMLLQYFFFLSWNIYNQIVISYALLALQSYITVLFNTLLSVKDFGSDNLEGGWLNWCHL